MTRENAAAKGRRYLSEGRLMLRDVTRSRVAAVCRGDGHLYAQTWTRGDGWTCDCPARTDGCAHLIALRLVVAVDLEDRP